MPTQSAWPDCLGFRGGPRGTLALRLDSELFLLRPVWSGPSALLCIGYRTEIRTAYRDLEFVQKARLAAVFRRITLHLQSGWRVQKSSHLPVAFGPEAGWCGVCYYSFGRKGYSWNLVQHKPGVMVYKEPSNSVSAVGGVGSKAGWGNVAEFEHVLLDIPRVARSFGDST